MSNNYAQTIFKSLVGHWRFDRVISNTGKMTGQAEFKYDTDNKDCLLYKEDGTHSLFEEQIAFEQKYSYCLEGNKISVFDARNEKMLDLNFDHSDTGAGDYMCINDHYAAVLDFQDNKNFTLHYTVKGPNKDYQIETRFERLDV